MAKTSTLKHTDDNVVALSRAETFVDFVLEGTIEAVEPIHVSTADKTPKDQVGVIVVPRIVNGQRVDMAAIKGETIKGFVRRCAVEVAIDVLKSRSNHPQDMPFTITPYYRNAIGGVKGKGDQSPDDVFLILATGKRNPIAYLFGAAEPYWMEGKVNFGFATAQIAQAWGPIAGGARRDDLLNDPARLASFAPEDQDKWLSYAETTKETSKSKGDVKILRKEQREILKKGTPSAIERQKLDDLSAQIKEIETGISDRKGAEAVRETINRPLEAKNAIYPGAVLDHKLDAMHLTFAQLGFFLKTFDRMSDNPRIGGHSSRGYGLFKARWSLRARVNEGGRRGSWETLGDVSLSHNDFVLPDHPLVKRAMDAFADMEKDLAVDFSFEERKAKSA